MFQKFPPGSLVGSGRWPGSSAHPDCWLVPHVGTVLNPRSSRLWPGLTRDEIAQRILEVRAIPILWDFGKIYWERPETLRSSREDFKAWSKARAEAYRRDQ